MNFISSGCPLTPLKIFCLCDVFHLQFLHLLAWTLSLQKLFVSGLLLAETLNKDNTFRISDFIH